MNESTTTAVRQTPEPHSNENATVSTDGNTPSDRDEIIFGGDPDTSTAHVSNGTVSFHIAEQSRDPLTLEEFTGLTELGEDIVGSVQGILTDILVFAGQTEQTLARHDSNATVGLTGHATITDNREFHPRTVIDGFVVEVPDDETDRIPPQLLIDCCSEFQDAATLSVNSDFVYVWYD